MEITIKNFKKFGEDGIKLDLAPITFLTGENGSGKSSLTKAVLVFQDYIMRTKETGGITNTPIDFSKFDLIDFDNTVNSQDTDKEICFSFKNHIDLYNRVVQASYYFSKYDGDLLNRGWLKRVNIIDSNGDTILFWEDNKERWRLNLRLLKNSFFELSKSFVEYQEPDIYIDTPPEQELFKEIFKSFTFDQFEDKARLIFAIKHNIVFDFDTVMELSSKSKEDAINTLNDIVIDSPGFEGIITFINSLKNSNNSFIECFRNEENSALEKSSFQVDFPFSGKYNDILDDYECKTDLIEDLKAHSEGLKTNDKSFRFSSPQLFKTTISTFFYNYVKLLLKKLALPNFIHDYTLIDIANNFKSEANTKILYSLLDTCFHYQKFSKDKNYVPHTFLNKWINKLGIAESISIKREIDGRLNIYLCKSNQEKLIHSEGLGLNKLVSILLQIETAIIKSKTFYDDGFSATPFYDRQTIVIEEPESHLHPKLQSLLCEIMYDAHKEYQIDFLVETHSEYMIRRSQVIVSGLGFKSNSEADQQSPFRTYYLPRNGEVYSLGYRKDGKFAKKFGEGFFDESSNLIFQLL